MFVLFLKSLDTRSVAPRAGGRGDIPATTASSRDTPTTQSATHWKRREFTTRYSGIQIHRLVAIIMLLPLVTPPDVARQAHHKWPRVLTSSWVSITNSHASRIGLLCRTPVIRHTQQHWSRHLPSSLVPPHVIVSHSMSRSLCVL